MSPAPTLQTTEAHAKAFKKVLESVNYSRGTREIFADWLEIAACALHNQPYHLGLPKDADYEKVEAQYMAAVKKYSREELDKFAEMIGIATIALEQEKTDFLGQLYMMLDMGNSYQGQFFTPFSLSEMMAQMQMHGVADEIEKKGFITVQEPACGAGGMVIAAAKVLEQQGFDPGKVMFFDATDVSQMCVDMTYVQATLCGLSGYVRHGNTLSMEQWGGRYTPICRMFPWRTRKFLNSLSGKEVESSALPEKVEPVASPVPQTLKGVARKPEQLAMGF